MVAFVDDLSTGGSLSNIKKWWSLCKKKPYAIHVQKLTTIEIQANAG